MAGIGQVWRRLAPLLVAAVATLGCAADATPPQAPMMFGVTTHFDQRWPLTLLDQVNALGARAIRDELSWGKGEPQRGHYAFDEGDSRYVRAACGRGIRVLLMVVPVNKAYDNGETAHSPAAQDAFGRYIRALADFYGSRCVDAIEIGNEINSDGLKLPKTLDRATVYAGLLAAVRRHLDPQQRGIAILGGSTNVIGTGFLEGLFQAGILATSDGIVVHPYRDHPEGVEVELARVAAAMRRAGIARPIWATEVGDQLDDPRAAASLMIRLVCLLSAAGVERAYWYDLVDEPAFRNMGLYDGAFRIKPAGRAARLVLARLSGHRAVRVEAGDRDSYIFRFGPGTLVMWGAPRPLHFSGRPRFFNAEGAEIAPVERLTEEPVIIVGDVRYSLGPGEVLADSLYQYAGPPWSYFARRGNGEMVPVGMIDWTWTSYFGSMSLRPFELTSASAIAAGDAANPVSPTLRYTAPANQTVRLAGCFSKAASGDGLRVTAYRNGKQILSSPLISRLTLDRPLGSLRKGDTLDFAFAPMGSAEGNALKYRIRLTAADSKVGVQCA